MGKKGRRTLSDGALRRMERRACVAQAFVMTWDDMVTKEDKRTEAKRECVSTIPT